MIDKLFTEAVFESLKDRESCKKLVLMSMQHYPSFFFLCMLSMWNIIWTNHERLLTAQESIRARIFNWLQLVMMTRLIRINLRFSAEFVCIVIEQPFAKKQEWWWRSWWLKRICGVGAAQTKFPKLSGCLFHKQTLPAMQNIRLKRK